MAESGNDEEEKSLGVMDMFCTLIVVVVTWVGVVTKIHLTTCILKMSAFCYM